MSLPARDLSAMSSSSSSGSASVTPGPQFSSDNVAAVCPEAWEALTQVNQGKVSSYGHDGWTEKASDRIRDVFETDCEVFFVFNGTAANSLALATCCAPYHSVICGETAHIETDECGGPEMFSGGAKILLVPTQDGRISSDDVRAVASRRTDIHFPKPRVLSVTLPTELGTVYEPSELAAISDTAKSLGLYLHMDGARFANAVASLETPPSELTWKLGVDILCFGGTKMGLPVGEAVIFFNKQLADEFDYRCKQSGQLASKMRYLAAPWWRILENDVWLHHARHANQSAKQLSQRLSQELKLTLLHPTEANAVFVALPEAVSQALHAKGWQFYHFIGAGGARLMCSWATTEAEIDALIRDAAESLA